MNLRGLLFFIIPFFITSCVSIKKLTYLQNKEIALADTTTRKDTVGKNYSRTDYKMQINDILSISIRSLDQQAVIIFNSPGVGGGQQGGATAGDIFYLNGYLINVEGEIDLPVIGKLKIIGLNLQEVKIAVQEEVKKYFKDAIVDVKLGGIRYSILGEVLRPGKNVVLQGQLNIFEAIANAGDLTVVANRNQVQIIRQLPTGPQIVEVDLTDRNILYSPYYFIQPNDIIYIKPLKVKSLGTGVTGVGTFQTIVSVLSAVILVITLSRLK